MVVVVFVIGSISQSPHPHLSLNTRSTSIILFFRPSWDAATSWTKLLTQSGKQCQPPHGLNWSQSASTMVWICQLNTCEFKKISVLSIARIITCMIDFTNVLLTWKSLDRIFFSSSYVRHDVWCSFDKTQSTICLSCDIGNVIIPWKNTAS